VAAEDNRRPEATQVRLKAKTPERHCVNGGLVAKLCFALALIAERNVDYDG